MKACRLCGQPLDVAGRPWTTDCGGDCRACMVEAGDPDEARLLLREVMALVAATL